MSELVDPSGLRDEVAALADRLDELRHQVDSGDIRGLELAAAALAELQTTVEELRVIRDELSAQNDALLESRQLLEEQHDRYRALFEAAPVAYLVTDNRGVVLEANHAAAALLNADEQFLLHKPLVTFIVPAHRPALRQLMATVSSTGRGSTHEWDIQPRRSAPLPASFEVARLRERTRGEALLWLVTDLSAERALRSRSERLAAVLHGSDDPTVTDAAVAFALDELRGLLLDEQSLEDVLTRVAQTGRDIIAGASGVSVSLFEQGRPRAGGTSAPWVQSVDDCQYAAQEGPCVAALADGTWQAADDLADEPRWPRFAAEAVAQGVLSCLSVPLLVRGARLGVLNVYSGSRASFSSNGVAVARRLGEVASVVAANAQVLAASRRLAHELEQALVSRSTVDMAKGILMARLHVGADTAFEALRDLSQRRHMKLRDLAAELVADLGG